MPPDPALVVGRRPLRRLAGEPLEVELSHRRIRLEVQRNEITDQREIEQRSGAPVFDE